MVLSKAGNTATFYAQGGIAVVLPKTDDSVDAHVADTLAAGAGLCDPEVVRSIVVDGYRAVRELVDDGARFDEAAPGQWSLTREGGHSRRRIIHAGGDATGAEVQRALDEAAARLDIRRNHVALEILHEDGAVTGVLTLNDDGLGIVHARSVILATGGLGHLYSATTNPEGSTGDGVALAMWAGLPVSDLEFIQFHPTMLFDGHAGGRRPLITEAVRGEGAVLVDSQGRSVTEGVHPMGDLAPRDVVAAAIDARMTETGDPCVYLDARGIKGFKKRFPTVTAACREAGIDPTRQAIPVVPGAHYSCGGVVTDVHGRTELAGLFAAGEVARTGMHGANRLASNSLLEGLVDRRPGRKGRCRTRFRRRLDRPLRYRRPAFDARCRGRELQRAMTRYAAVVRDEDGLRALSQVLETASPRELELAQGFRGCCADRAAGAVMAAALERTESRGCHHRADYPNTDPAHGPQSGRPARGLRLMELNADELTEARRVIARGLDGRPAVRTRCHHPGDGERRCDDDGVDGRPPAGRHRRCGHCSAGARRGAGRRRLCRQAPRRRWRAAGGRRGGADRRGAHARVADRRADHAEPGVPSVGYRHNDRGLGGCRRGHRGARSATPARRCPDCELCRSTRYASAVA